MRALVQLSIVLAASLATAVDRRVREHLVAGRVALLPPRAGRRTVSEAWVRSLTAPDPWLSPSLDPSRLRSVRFVFDRAIWGTVQVDDVGIWVNPNPAFFAARVP